MPSAHKIVGKMLVMVEIELEREVIDIEGEVCRRIAMHPHVRDANWIFKQFVETKVELNDGY